MATSSCESMWDMVLGGSETQKLSTSQLKTQTNSNKNQVSKAEISDTGIQTCRDDLSKITALKNIQSESENDLRLEIVSTEIKDESTLAKWVVDFAKDVFFTKGCPWNSIHFIAAVTEESYYRGSVSRADVDFFRKEKISVAELYRRMEINRMETELSLRTRLLKARSSKSHDEALELVGKLLELDHDDVTLNIIQANVYRDQKAYAEAQNIYQLVLEIHPNDLQALLNLAFVQKEMGSFAEAIANFLKAEPLLVAAANQNIMTQDLFNLQIADTHFKNREIDKAKSRLALVQDTKNYHYQVLMMNLVRLEKKFEEALALISQMDVEQQDDALVLFNKTLLHLDLHDEDSAKQTFEKLKSIKAAYADELAFLKIFGGTDDAPEIDAETEDKPAEITDDMVLPIATPVEPPKAETEDDVQPIQDSKDGDVNPEQDEETELLF